MKQLILAFFLVFCVVGVQAQFTLDEIKSLELGQKFTDAEQIVRTKLGANISTFEGDTLDTYKIESPESDSIWIVKTEQPTFDVYGTCRYSFKFAKNVLIAVEIRFEFLANDEDKENFAQTLRSIDSNFSGDGDLHLLKTAGEDLNIDKIINQVNNSCDTKEDNEAYLKQSAFMGMKAWEIHKRVNNVPRHKFLTLQVQKTVMNTPPYAGCVSVVEMTICNEEFIELYNMLNEMKIKYQAVAEE